MYGAFGYTHPHSRLGTDSASEAAIVIKMTERTVEACNDIKATGGIRIYTVGFQMRDKDAIALLRSCASEESMAFLSDTNSELIKTFEKIAMDISTLRITSANSRKRRASGVRASAFPDEG